MILDGGKKSDSLFRMCNEGALYDVPIIMGTHYDAVYPWAPLLQPTLGGWNMMHFRDYSHKYSHCHLNWSHQDKLYRTK